MEVGAVKQAFNNELILLKKKLNQAKIQVIHKLTRKAKTLVDKKAPESLQEKFKRKAESAVKEVLIIKKIKVRDIGRFIITHPKELQDHLNKPDVDEDKACARLLLHKSLADKYKYIRNKFSNVPINDLLMSRQERRKLKKEARDLQKSKNKAKRDKKDAKNKVVNAKGDWNVEDVKTGAKTNEEKDKSDLEESDDDQGSDDDKHDNADGDNSSDFNGNELEVNSDYDSNDDDPDSNIPEIIAKSVTEKKKTSIKHPLLHKESESNLSDLASNKSEDSSGNEDNDDDELEIGSNGENHDVDEDVNAISKVSIKSPMKQTKASQGKKETKPDKKTPVESSAFKLKLLENKPNITNKPEKKPKDNKNKNLKEKIQYKKFKKDSTDAPVTESKIVDPFFITSTGENYMSVVEVRPPDEIKDEHRQGNRQLRRARMFGHVPKIKPRSQFRPDNGNRQNGFASRNNSDGKYGKDQKNKFEGNYKLNNKDTANFKGRDNKHSNFKDRSFEDRDSLKNKGFKRTIDEESKPEKLHPSWEAKKKQSGIIPFQGKKIVFD